MAAIARKVGPSLFVDEPGDRIGKQAARIMLGRMAIGLDMQHPARGQAPQRIVQARGGSDQLGLGGTFQVGAAVAQGPLERAVLVQYDAGSDQACPREPVGNPGRLVLIFTQVQHGAFLDVQQRGILDVAREHLQELRVQSRSPDRQGMPGEPEPQAR